MCSAYVTVTPLPLRATTLPLVIFGALGITVAEVLVVDPLRCELPGLLGLLGGLEETERAQNAVAGLDRHSRQTRKLAKLRDERLVDLADDLVRAGRVDAFVPTNGAYM